MSSLRRERSPRQRTLALGFLMLAALLVLSLLAAKPAHAADFTVNSTGDAGDTTPDGTCDSNFTVTVTCTLREAIQESNASTSVNDSIIFDIGNDGGVKTISPASALPAITDRVTIDGYTQAGSAVNTKTNNTSNAVLKVELNGAGAGAFAQGLFITGADAADTAIKGLVINRFGGDGVFADAGAAVVEGNFIGTDPSGTIDRGNGSEGVRVTSSGNLIGGAANRAQNVISGNAGNGVSVLGSTSTNNVVSNNHIGTDADAGADLGNSKNGVQVVRAPGVVVGGSSADGAHNIISGNDEHGVLVDGAEGTKVLGNLIGLERNGFGFSNIGNTLDGVKVENAPRVEIGGTLTGQGNTISDNGQHGVEIIGSGDGKVQGNRVGTNASASFAAGNAGRGVLVGNASNNVIGGRSTGARNVISGNASDGILISGADATNNRIQGNFIGTDGTGVKDLENLQGVNISGASGNFVGGSVAGAGNLIFGNDGDGVVISGAGATANRILRNSIFSNGGLGIDLVGGTENAAGATANDSKDPDSGPNTLQNKPAIRSATTTKSSLTVSGNLNSTPNKTFTIQFFSNPNGNEGKTFLAQRRVTTNVNGNASFTFSVSVAAGHRITATATRAGNTSEFSAPRAAS